MATLDRSGRVRHNGQKASFSVSIEGMAEVEDALLNVEKGVAFKIVEKALEKAGKIVVQDKTEAPVSTKKEWLTQHRHITKSKGFTLQIKKHRPGDLRRSFGVILAKKSKTPLVYAGPRMGLKFNPDGYYGAWVAFGARNRGGGVKKVNDFMGRIYERRKTQIENSIVNEVFELVDDYFESYGFK